MEIKERYIFQIWCISSFSKYCTPCVIAIVRISPRTPPGTTAIEISLLLLYFSLLRSFLAAEV